MQSREPITRRRCATARRFPTTRVDRVEHRVPHRAERGDKEETGFVDRQIDQRPAAGRIANFKPPFVWIDVDVAMRLSRHMAMASNAAAEGGVRMRYSKLICMGLYARRAV
ncbi:hypothetical protein [Burkholderia anthina]|uniref:hypothetical protein n=1 Tax=Burkholderia anthina TaxID=179879 RepID=UPI0012DA211C|nr:hypothetical protein [Burkholderia anthina]